MWSFCVGSHYEALGSDKGVSPRDGLTCLLTIKYIFRGEKSER